MKAADRGSWTGHVGFVLAAAGSAIGLGNIWMFPYRTGQHGGGAFVIVYFGAVLLVGIPLLVAEVLLGRASKRGPVGAFKHFAGSSSWPVVGWLGVAAGFVILSFYGVVAGWAMDYTWRAARGLLAELDQQSLEAAFRELAADGGRQVAWQASFMVATIVVVAQGIEAGIERASKILMPMLLAFLFLLLGYSLTSQGAGEGLAFLLKPRFEELGWNGVLAALGQAFFSLSLGMGAMITYGSYLENKQSIPGAALQIAVVDTAMAILAGLVIFPLVFSFGLEPGAGPGLVFITLPRVFSLMPASSLLATVFFLLVVFAALTSAISLLEVVVAFAVDELGWRRAPASWTAGAVIFALGVPSATVAGFLGRVDELTSNWMLPVGGLLIALFVGWRLNGEQVRAGYVADSDDSRGIDPWRLCIRYLAPLAVAVILLQNIGLID